ncbi:MAG TPA: NUDIX hydrolase [Bacillota bacterium]|nr:NUDIX hydrolase [Bacillota bacterium]
MKTLKSEKMFSGKMISVYKDQVVLENGKETERELVRHKEAAAVVAVNNKGDLLMVEQHRYAIGQKQHELPAGLLDEGETPLVAAKRELLEETGYIGNSWDHLISLYMSPGIHDEKIHIYMATDLEEAGLQSLDEDELLTFGTMSLKQVLEGIKNGDITDGKTVTGVLMYSHLKDI